MYKRRKKATVELTSLLDLLFVMIFLSLIQQKNVKPTPKKAKVAKVKTVKPKVKAKPRVKPVVHKIHTIGAVFSFYAPASNPKIPSGSYQMQGRYDGKSGYLYLGGIAWVNKPQVEIGMVPLSGKIDVKNNIFTGRVDFQGCQTFNLKRVAGSNSQNPVAGIWKGTYVCAQGPTGLTLTIE